MSIQTRAVERLLAHKKNHVWGNDRSDHEAAGAIILAQDTGKILLQHRSPDSMEPLTWGQFGGSLEGTETIEQGCKREIWEETGYRGAMKLIPLTISGDPAHDFKYFNFLGIVPKQYAVHSNEESYGHLWFDPKGQWPRPLHPGMVKAMRDPKAKKILAQHGIYFKA